MRIHISSKLFNLVLFAGISFLILFMISSLFVKRLDFDVSSSCYSINRTDSFCVFNCEFLPYCAENNVFGRIFVAHTGWAGIHDKTVNMTCNINNSHSVVLPRRDYRFILRSAFFNNDSVGASNVIYLFC